MPASRRWQPARLVQPGGIMHELTFTSRRRPASVVLILLALLASLTAVAASPRPAVAAPSPADSYPILHGEKCPDVVVVAARGSGEEPQNDWDSPAAYREPVDFGVGKANREVYKLLRRSSRHLKFGLAPVRYPALPAWDSLLRNEHFNESVATGASAILADVDQIEQLCDGGVKYVFTGYSQGAWAVHKALWDLPRELRGKVLGVTLFGDPKFVPWPLPGSEIVREHRLRLRYFGVATLGGVSLGDTDVPTSLRARTASYCFSDDPVCQGPPKRSFARELAVCSNPRLNSPDGLCAHTRYKTDGKSATAARFLARRMPTRSVWPRLTGPNPPAGKVGMAYSWTATAAPTARTTYRWTALDAPPPGLSFSGSGLLSGTPTRAGRYTFRIQARSDPQDRTVTEPVTVRIRPGSAPPPPGCAGPCTVATWGANSVGQLGNGTTTDSSTPVQVSGLSGVTAIAGGHAYSLALRTDGTVWAWGHNESGQLGNGTTTNSSTPVQVSGLSGVTAIAAGFQYGLALRSDGTVWAWGLNEFGELGNGTTTNSSTPVQVSGLSGATAIASGNHHSLALRTDGTVWAWGHNLWGQLGNGTTADSWTPVQVSGLSSVSSIASGEHFSLALRTDGTVWAWGDGVFGELGDGAMTNSSTPVQVSGLSGVIAIAGGFSFALAVRTDGTAWGWGLNSDGQLGNGTTTSSSTPVQVNGLSGATAIAAGAFHGLVLRTDGTVWAWGQNDSGQLGNGTTVTSSTPVQVSALSGATAIAAGHWHSLAMRT
jgi:alpha-tubulin suppressor-like RCC1 family protein